MIYTITFNPSLDYIMHVDCFEEGETNRSKQEEIYPGGKGFNVSTILSRLNLETTALGFVAGFTGEEIVDGNIFNNNTKITTEKIKEDNTNNIYYYKLSTQNLMDMGLKNVKSDEKDGYYIVKYDLKNSTIEIYNTEGFDDEGNVVYSLTDIKQVRLK